MGFPDNCEFAGNKTETAEQVSNAILVNLTKKLCEQLFLGDEPLLQTYAGQEVEADDWRTRQW